MTRRPAGGGGGPGAAVARALDAAFAARPRGSAAVAPLGVTLAPAAEGETCAGTPPGGIGVAVSGGSDSRALLLLVADWARATGREIAAVTVDHGLRPGSAAEAERVAALCAARGIRHAVLRWQTGPGRGNLQAEARDARRVLIADWARAGGLAAVALGHTLDDQAETFVMRLARGSGVDGLAGMAPAGAALGILWLRPLLGLRRAALREFLAAEGVGWDEDPTNVDPAFHRVRVRAALPGLAALGLTPERLAGTAARMAEARAALDAATAEVAGRALAPGPAGGLLLDAAALAGVPREIALRLFAGALTWVSGARYRPRLARLEPVLDAALAGRVGAGLSLHGCVIRRAGGRLALRREPARAAPPVPIGALRWDGRWELAGGPVRDGLAIGATGAAGLAALPRWRDSGIPRESLLAAPAIWEGARLVAAPFAAPGPWCFRRVATNPPHWIAPAISLNRPAQGLC